MRSRQAGITFIGWLILLVPVAIVVYAGIRMFPKYLNYYNLSKAMQNTATEFAGDDATSINATAVRRALQGRFDVTDIDYPAVSDIQVVRDGDHWVMRVNYEETAPLFGHISLLLNFDKTVPIQ